MRIRLPSDKLQAGIRVVSVGAVAWVIWLLAVALWGWANPPSREDAFLVNLHANNVAADLGNTPDSGLVEMGRKDCSDWTRYGSEAMVQAREADVASNSDGSATREHVFSAALNYLCPPAGWKPNTGDPSQ